MKEVSVLDNVDLAFTLTSDEDIIYTDFSDDDFMFDEKVWTELMSPLIIKVYNNKLTIMRTILCHKIFYQNIFKCIFQVGL